MKLRTLALALALSCTAVPMVEAASHHKVKPKKVKMVRSKRYKQSQASKVKPRKAPRRK